jgi:CBS domain-containing protein
MDNTARFRKAFHDLLKLIYQWSPQNEYYPLETAVQEAGKQFPAIRYYQAEILVSGRLYEAISIEHEGEISLAEPNQVAIGHVEKILKFVKDPPKVFPLFQRDVATLSIQDTVGKAVEIMQRDDYSQIPIYSRDYQLGLITSDVLTRWIGATRANGVAPDYRSPLADVMAFQDPKKDPRCLVFHRDDTLFTALDSIRVSENAGVKFGAILIVHGADEPGRLDGIITSTDLGTARHFLRLSDKASPEGGMSAA